MIRGLVLLFLNTFSNYFTTRNVNQDFNILDILLCFKQFCFYSALYIHGCCPAGRMIYKLILICLILFLNSEQFFYSFCKKTKQKSILAVWCHQHGSPWVWYAFKSTVSGIIPTYSNTFNFGLNQINKKMLDKSQSCTSCGLSKLSLYYSSKQDRLIDS